MRRFSLLLLLFTTTSLVSQDVLRSTPNPTPAEVQTARDVLKKEAGEPNVLAFGGYAFAVIETTAKMTWYPVPGGTGSIDKIFIPKNTTYRGWLVAKGQTAFEFITIPPDAKDRYLITGTKFGTATLLCITNGATPEADHNVAYYHFLVGDKPPVVVPPVVVPPVVIPPVVDPPVVPVAEKLGFVTMAMTEGVKVPAAARVHAAALATNFEAIAAQLAANSSMTVDAANDLLRDKNLATIGAARPSWLPWFTAWGALADKHNNSGTMATSADYVTAFTETATGLKKVK